MSNTQLTKADTHLSSASRDSFLDAQQLQLLSDTIMKGASPDEMAFFGQVCQRTKLDPFRRQIYAVSRWDNKLKRNVWTFQTSIDGYRAIAQRTGTYAGSDDPIFDPPDESAPHPRKATTTVWKLVGGQRVPFTASARWEEYKQEARKKDGGTYLTGMWSKMPYGQLSKCSESLALRKAFPEELSGIYTEEEMEQASNSAQPEPSGYGLRKHQESSPGKEENLTQSAPEIEVQIVEADTAGIPEEIAAFVGGRWKVAKTAGNKPLGALKLPELQQLRDNPPEPLKAALSASYVDQIRATLDRADIAPDKFAYEVSQNADFPAIDWPADLWADPASYPALLALAQEQAAGE